MKLIWTDTLNDALYALYDAACGTEWPLCKARFFALGCDRAVVALEGDGPVGFAVVASGCLSLLTVRPDRRGNGLGSALLRAAERSLLNDGADTVRLGRGPGYLWQGAPAETEGFFLRHGYSTTEYSVDMVLPLAGWTPPAWALPPAGVTLRCAASAGADGLPATTASADADGLPATTASADADGLPATTASADADGLPATTASADADGLPATTASADADGLPATTASADADGLPSTTASAGADGLPATTASADADGLLAALCDPDTVGWRGIYTDALAAGRYDSILLALRGGRVVGFTLVEPSGMTWERCFFGPIGGLGCLGVRESERGAGIGRALAAEGTRRLREAGCAVSYLGWTWLEDWYGALGYRVWRRFAMMEKTL